MTMESDTELERLRNEVFRKIGRNVLNFQNLERKLKFLIANGQIAGYASELRRNGSDTRRPSKANDGSPRRGLLKAP